MYVIDDEFGVALLVMLGIGVFISFLIPIIFRNKIYATLSFPKHVMEKGETLVGKLVLQNTLFLPTPWIDITCVKKRNFNYNGPIVIRIMMGIKEVVEIPLSYTALSRGMTPIGIEKLEFRNVFGLKSTAITKEYNTLQQEIMVMPEIYTINANHPFIVGTIQQDDQEECAESSQVMRMPSSELGFECRNYEPGDALTRIHWKQSAKSNTLMVRKNLYTSRGRKILVLDPRTAAHFHPKEREQQESDLLEAFLSLGNALYESGVETELCFFLGNRWIHHFLEDVTAIRRLQFQLASYPFIEMTGDLATRLRGLLHNYESLSKSLHITLFTTSPTLDIQRTVEIYKAKNIYLTPVEHSKLKEEQG